jgi:hypothetical protein
MAAGLGSLTGQGAGGAGAGQAAQGAAAGAAAGAGPGQAAGGDPMQRLQQLKGMLDQDLITQQDYDAAKAEILKRLAGG